MTPALGRKYHQALSVRGALNWDKRMTKRMAAASGMTPEAFRNALMDHLSRGEELVRMDGCDNLDPKHGCMGHDVEAPE